MKDEEEMETYSTMDGKMSYYYARRMKMHFVRFSFIWLRKKKRINSYKLTGLYLAHNALKPHTQTITHSPG